MRYPVAAGTFYPSSRAALQEDIDSFIEKKKPGFNHGIVPHAGYEFSGHCAAQTFSRLKKPDTFIILGPNHYGAGEKTAMDQRRWITPLGTMEIDVSLASEINIPVDQKAHDNEHSIEVQLPFIQRLFPGTKFLPISIRACEPKGLAKKIRKGIKKSNKKVSIIASSDLTHYGPNYHFTPFPPEKAVDVDRKMLESIAGLDIAGFEKIAGKTSICGSYPILVLMALMRNRGKVLCYENSSKTTGDKTNFVGYGSVVFR